MKNSLLYCVLFLLLSGRVFGESPDSTKQAKLVDDIQVKMMAEKIQIDPWARKAAWLIASAVFAGAVGVTVAGLQQWSNRTWCRITNVILGVAVTGTTIVANISPVSYKECSERVDRARAYLTRIEGLLYVLNHGSQSDEQIKVMREEFEGYLRGINEAIDELDGRRKNPPPPPPAPPTASNAADWYQDDQVAPRSLFTLASYSQSAPSNSSGPTTARAPFNAVMVQAPGSRCEDFSGTWQVSDLTPMQISQRGCNFDANVDSLDHSYRHLVRGEVWATAATITVERWDPAGCYTELYGVVSIRYGRLMWDINGTAGKCGLPSSYREHREWSRR